MTASYNTLYSTERRQVRGQPMSSTIAADLPGACDPADPIDERRSVLIPGTILAARYRVIEAIGTGGMGSVYLGEHVSVGRKVAIKVLHAHWSRVPAIVARFEGEARMTSAIGHPGIVDILDTGVLPDGRLYMVMEHLAGKDLQAELKGHGPFTPLRACRILRAAAEAIAAAHAVGVVHRDLKPDNIVVTRQRGEEVVKVLDFGVAADSTRGSLSVASTTPGTVLGTPEHMPPEQGLGETAGPHFDIYALGSVLFTLLEGHPPFLDSNPLRMLARKQSEPAPALVGDGDLPPSLVALVADTLAIEVTERPASATELLRRLDEVIATLARSAADTHASHPQANGAAQTIEAPLSAASTSRRPWRLATAILGVAALLGAWALWPEPAPTDPTASLANDTSTPTTSPASVPGDTSTPTTGPTSVPGDANKTAPEPAIAIAESPTPAPALAEPPAPALLAKPTPIRRKPPAARSAGLEPAAPSEASPREPAVAEHLTPRCQQIRERARVAQTAFRWSTVLELSTRRDCWEQPAVARKLEAQASMETGDFAGCLAASAGLKDSESTRWRGICRKRAGLE